MRSCSVFRYGGTGLTTDAFAERSLAWLRGPDDRFGWSGAPRPEAVTLAGGGAIVIDVVSDLVGRPGVDVILGSGDVIFVLACRGIDGTDTEWLAIAETFEILPLEEPSPVYAPDDLAAILPEQVGDVTMRVQSGIRRRPGGLLARRRDTRAVAPSGREGPRRSADRSRHWVTGSSSHPSSTVSRAASSRRPVTTRVGARSVGRPGSSARVCRCPPCGCLASPDASL
jgi:hypothetical protein